MNPNDPAFPSGHKQHYECMHDLGLTKREYFAAMAMQGFCANLARSEETFEGDALASVKQADALIAELSKENPK